MAENEQIGGLTFAVDGGDDHRRDDCDEARDEPAVIVTAIYGESKTTDLLVLSQVILSLQLPFAVIPLIVFTSDRKKMGEFVSPMWVKVLAWVTATIIVVLNVKLLADFFGLTAWLTGGK